MYIEFAPAMDASCQGALLLRHSRRGEADVSPPRSAGAITGEGAARISQLVTSMATSASISDEGIYSGHNRIEEFPRIYSTPNIISHLHTDSHTYIHTDM